MRFELAAAASVALALSRVGGGSVPADDVAKSPGLYERRVTTQRGEKLRYTISIPQAFSPDRACPLVVALHYAGVVTPFYGKGVLVQLVEPALRDLGALIVAPDCPGEDWMEPASEAMVLALVDHLKRSYKIRRGRVLVTGYSMGGVGAWHLAARHADIFSAAIAVSAVPPPETVGLIERISLYVIHSRQDEVFPMRRIEIAVEALKARGVRVHLEALEGASHYDVHAFVEPLRAAVPWIKQTWGSAGACGAG